MHKANWHAFTLLIDTTLLPMHHFLQRNRHVLTPRKIIHLPANDKSLRLRMRRISEEGGSGGVLVMACDLSNARRILAAASRFEMLAGRFIWLWLDLKAELRPNEPGLISSHSLHSSLMSSSRNDPERLISPLENVLERHGASLVLDDESHLHALPNLASDVHKLQEYRWQHDKKTVRKREDRPFVFDDDEEIRMTDKALNSKTFMPVGMLALRPSSLKISGGDTILTRMLRETSQALDNTFNELKSSLSRLRETQLKEHFVPTCFAEFNAKVSINEVKDNVSRTLTKKLRESMRQISRDKAEFQLLNLQAVQFPGNKTQLR